MVGMVKDIITIGIGRPMTIREVANVAGIIGCPAAEGEGNVGCLSRSGGENTATEGEFTCSGIPSRRVCEGCKLRTSYLLGMSVNKILIKRARN